MKHNKLYNERIVPMINEMYLNAPSIFPVDEQYPVTVELSKAIQAVNASGDHAFPYNAYYISEEKYQLIKKKYSKYLRKKDFDELSFVASNYAPNTSWENFLQLKAEFANYLKSDSQPNSSIAVAASYYKKYQELVHFAIRVFTDWIAPTNSDLVNFPIEKVIAADKIRKDVKLLTNSN